MAIAVRGARDPLADMGGPDVVRARWAEARTLLTEVASNER